MVGFFFFFFGGGGIEKLPAKTAKFSGNVHGKFVDVPFKRVFGRWF